MKLLMCHSKKYPGTHCPGRFAMVCCENDVQFLGLVAKGVDLNKYKNRDWVEVDSPYGFGKSLRLQGQGPGNAHHLHQALRKARQRGCDLLIY